MDEYKKEYGIYGCTHTNHAGQHMPDVHTPQAEMNDIIRLIIPLEWQSVCVGIVILADVTSSPTTSYAPNAPP